MNDVGLLRQTRNMYRLSLWKHLRLLVRMVWRIGEEFPCSGDEHSN